MPRNQKKAQRHNVATRRRVAPPAHVSKPSVIQDAQGSRNRSLGLPSPPPTNDDANMDGDQQQDDVSSQAESDYSDEVDPAEEAVSPTPRGPRRKNPPAPAVPSDPMAERIAAIPEELRFFLTRNLDLMKRPCTKATFTKIIQHFFPTYKPPSGCSRPVLLEAYKNKVLPLLSAHLKSIGLDHKENPTAEADAVMMEPAEPRKELPLAGINPHNASITIDIICRLIAQQHPEVVLPRKLKKPAAIALYHTYIMAEPAIGRYPEPFSETPHLVPVPYHTLLTKEELRFGLHCHAPMVFVVEGNTKPELEAIYVQFALEDIHEEGPPVFERVHYFIVHPK